MKSVRNLSLASFGADSLIAEILLVDSGALPDIASERKYVAFDDYASLPQFLSAGASKSEGHRRGIRRARFNGSPFWIISVTLSL